MGWKLSLGAVQEIEGIPGLGRLSLTAHERRHSSSHDRAEGMPLLPGVDHRLPRHKMPPKLGCGRSLST